MEQERFRVIHPYDEDEPWLMDGDRHINLEEAIDLLNEMDMRIRELEQD